VLQSAASAHRQSVTSAASNLAANDAARRTSLLSIVESVQQVDEAS
jgi:hypothetical protein